MKGILCELSMPLFVYFKRAISLSDLQFTVELNHLGIEDIYLLTDLSLELIDALLNLVNCLIKFALQL